MAPGLFRRVYDCLIGTEDEGLPSSKNPTQQAIYPSFTAATSQIPNFPPNAAIQVPQIGLPAGWVLHGQYDPCGQLLGYLPLLPPGSALAASESPVTAFGGLQPAFHFPAAIPFSPFPHSHLPTPTQQQQPQQPSVGANPTAQQQHFPVAAQLNAGLNWHPAQTSIPPLFQPQQPPSKPGPATDGPQTTRTPKIRRRVVMSSDSESDDGHFNATQNDIRWDGWPNGDFEQLFTWEQFQKTGQLQVHWACSPGGGVKGGRDDAENWEAGKKTIRQCQGVIKCNNNQCQILIRPKTRLAKIMEQLSRRCECGSRLVHIDCGIKSSYSAFKGGVYYINGGEHKHPRPGHQLHLLNKQRRQLDRILEEHPNTSPLSLLVGRPGINGPKESLATISPVLMNTDRIRAEKRRVKSQGKPSNDQFLIQFSKFSTEHPKFVVFSQIGPETIISLQTPFMSMQLVKDWIEEDAVNGIVSDAAHGFWSDRMNLLILSSTYCIPLRCWVPALMSYSNGSSEGHYSLHYRVLLETLADEAERQGVELVDALFKMVVDFSEAQRAGFIQAFVDFWQARNNPRTEEQLREAAAALLKGCRYHFRNQVTQVKKISAVVHPALVETFENRCLNLLELKTASEFLTNANALLNQFPKAEGWLAWWMRDSHAQMLFESHRTMEPELWDAIPETTNAEESMHNKLYTALGRDHSNIVVGLEYLWTFAQHYQTLAIGAAGGAKIFYRERESWKKVKDRVGYTKPSRHIAKRDSRKSDGRPPDTARALLVKQKREKASESSSGNATDKIQSFIWRNNSCWLDASLDIIYHVVAKNYTSCFAPQMAEVKQPESLWFLAQAMDLRYKMSSGDSHGQHSSAMANILGINRDGLLSYLEQNNLVSLDKRRFASLFAWLEHIMTYKRDRTQTRAQSFFEFCRFTLRICTGDKATQLACPHFQIDFHVNNISCSSLTASKSEIYNGHVKLWFRNLFRVANAKNGTQLPRCWREDRHNTLYCSGSAKFQEIFYSIPIMFIIELEVHENTVNKWNFPKTLVPLNAEAKNSHGVVYDIVGRIFSESGDTHFTTIFTPDGSSVYTYDGQLHSGCAVRLQKGHVSTHIAGEAIAMRGNKHPVAIVYRLRGGLQAQKHFTEIQTRSIVSQLPVTFIQRPGHDFVSPTVEGPGIEAFPDEDRVWMTNPFSTRTQEFIEALSSTMAPTTLKRRAAASKKPPGTLGAENLFDSDVPFEISNEGTKNIPPVKIPPIKLPAKHVQILSPVRSPVVPPELLSSQESDFTLNCRCSMVGSGYATDTENNAKAIQCHNCLQWSHIACQKNGRASTLKSSKARFYCDYCIFVLYGSSRGQEPQKRKKATRRSRREPKTPLVPLSKRLMVGKGALARHGKYWYPVRLIEKDISPVASQCQWHVRWWRECKFGHAKAPESTLVQEEDLVDELWHDKQSRRKIRLGKWTRSWEIEDNDDILLAFDRQPYSDEIDAILKPHRATLEALLDLDPFHAQPGSSYSHIPAVSYLHTLLHASLPHGPGRILAKGRGIIYSGDISTQIHAQILNWYSSNIPGAKDQRIKWFGKLPIGHAMTLYIATQKREVLIERCNEYPALESDEEKTNALWKEAWLDLQTSSPNLRAMLTADVDRECLAALEERMFEDSLDAGPGGYQQWGLDAGEHQGRWCPYAGIPLAWIHHDNDDEGDMSPTDLMRGPEFSGGSESDGALTAPPSLPRPKPRPLKKRRTNLEPPSPAEQEVLVVG